jgi:PTS system maltose and glucose-specific IIC component
MLSAALTAFVTGITEPLEFAFMFCAPLLYCPYCVNRCGIYVDAYPANHNRANFLWWTYRLLLFGVLQGNAKTNWLLMLPLGVVMFCLYYFFRFLIQWRHLNTPGREQEEDATDTAIVANERAAGIVRWADAKILSTLTAVPRACA